MTTIVETIKCWLCAGSGSVRRLRYYHSAPRRILECNGTGRQLIYHRNYEDESE